MAYVSVADALAITGTTLDAEAIRRAQYLIELSTNRTEAASGDMSERDLYWLKLATAFQASYIDSHPEVYAGMDISYLTQGDVSISFRSRSESIWLAPMARKALNNVSWMRNRSVLVNSQFQRGSIDADVSDYVDADSDDGDWEPL